MADIRVLIVDDIRQVCHELHTLLHLSGFVQVIGEAADGAEAVRMATKLEPDAILMDLEMPVMDGYEAARQIKTLFPSCRVIALSIHEDAASRQKSEEAGADAFVSKACHLQELLDAIRAAGTSSDSPAINEGEKS